MTDFLSSLVRNARRAAGITLRTLAEQVNCTPSFLSEMENGIRPAPKDEATLLKLANALDLEPHKVLMAAQKDRERRDIAVIRDLFIKDDELAACYCRAKENWDEEQIKAVLMEAFTRNRSK